MCCSSMASPQERLRDVSRFASHKTQTTQPLNVGTCKLVARMKWLNSNWNIICSKLKGLFFTSGNKVTKPAEISRGSGIEKIKYCINNTQTLCAFTNISYILSVKTVFNTDFFSFPISFCSYWYNILQSCKMILLLTRTGEISPPLNLKLIRKNLPNPICQLKTKQNKTKQNILAHLTEWLNK